MKKIGITGAPGSGKSTIWRAITGSDTGDLATVEVPEPRLDKLVELHSSRKRVAAQIEVLDVHASARTSSAAIAKLREMEALLVVLGAFGGQDPKAEAQNFTDEMLLADMGPVETRLTRARKDPAAKHEIPVLEAAMKTLEGGEFLSTRTWEKPELDVFSALAPITLRPVLLVWNVDEESLSSEMPDLGFQSFVVCGSIEAEVAGLSPEDAKPLLEAYGVTEPALNKVVSAVYRSLDLITYFTASDKEARAWEVRKGATAPEAAGVIHSDLQRGFIRAEVVSYEALVEAGSWDGAKAKGLTRVEGKEYIFQEGDVTHFRFAV